ncbi:translation initiation factor IF-3 [Tissierella pigra]|uniref:Translation initiation factor IF-3 n=1 Tax=Tissierella pigra TaxID=2607614 RepID=A0A6N7XVF2_9FIRM|nr:translation initiation factor IF-3 [Tissierella pigra]MBU5427314.1 translation initiation factor IF-3 [Tissierella pigra]MSU01433.1 translation initiation factor IF-3 [Tissierella pigra]
MFLRIIRRCCTIKELQINEEIRDKEVRLIDVDGSQLGIVPIKKALEISEEKRLDLVKIAPTANPPVCRIMDYGKYKYELAKKEKEARKNQKIINVKEIRLTPNIETHDLNVKAKTASKFLESGDKVKVSVRFRGREMGHTEIGREVLNDFAKLTGEFGIIEKPAKLEGRSMVMYLTPRTE